MRGKQRQCVRYSIKKDEEAILIGWLSGLNDVSDGERFYESAAFLVLLTTEKASAKRLGLLQSGCKITTIY